MAKKKVTEEEVENGAKKVKVEKIVPKMKKITPKRSPSKWLKRPLWRMWRRT